MKNFSTRQSASLNNKKYGRKMCIKKFEKQKLNSETPEMRETRLQRQGGGTSKNSVKGGIFVFAGI